MLTLGKVPLVSNSTKQEANSRNSTEAELNNLDDKINKIFMGEKLC